MPPKVIISGGGTGGHIFPAIAIAHALKRINSELQILFIGASGRMEMEKVPKAGYEIKGLPVAGIQRKWSWKNLAVPFQLIRSMIQARSYLKAFQPDAVVGVGGYASAPVLFTASLMRIPTLIQEQNSYAGITNKILAGRAKKICVAYEGMEQFFPKEKIILSGNPVRKDLLNLESKVAEAIRFFGLSGNMKTLLVMGGSLGARSINESIRLHLSMLADANVQLVWQTGKGYYRENAEAAGPFSRSTKVYEFIERMDLAYAVADVVISRAGALSISELCIVRKACVLVPSPNVTEDHQTKNAIALVNKRAAWLVKDSEAKEKLVSIAMQLLNDEPKQEELKKNISSLARLNADDVISREILKLIEPSN